MTDKLAPLFMARFAGLDRAYGCYDLSAITEDASGKKVKGVANTVKKPLEVKQWQQHLNGEKGLGIIPINDNAEVVWGAVDIDVYDLDITALAMSLKPSPLIVCRTKSGGAHIYLFTSEPVSAALMRDRLSAVAKALGHPGVEIFPKQEKLVSKNDVGNWINMPYFDAAVTNRYAIDPETGKPLPAQQFLNLAAEKALSAERLQTMKVKKEGVEDGEEDFADGPPCLQYLIKTGFPQGSMNHALFDLGVYYRKKYPEDWEDRVATANQKWMGPGSYKEVQGIIKSLSRKTYAYKCSDIPICNHCNKAVCQKREYGIPSPAEKRREKLDARPCILDEVDRPVRCYMPPEDSDDEPSWVFKIGGKALDVNIDMLSDQRRFLRTILKHFHRLMLPVTEDRWAEGVNEILADVEHVELPTDAGPEGHLWIHLEEFCTGKVQAKDKSELLTGKPWTEPSPDEGEPSTTWFRSKDFFKYLDQQHFRTYKEKELWGIFRRKGARHTTFMIKGKCVSCWGVNEFDKQTEGFDVPEIPVEKQEVPF